MEFFLQILSHLSFRKNSRHNHRCPSSDTKTPFLDLLFQMVSFFLLFFLFLFFSKIYDTRGDFDFDTVHFPF